MVGIFEHLVSLGCSIFAEIGIYDTIHCDELRKNAETNRALVWFKILFGPSLILIIALLYFMEDYFLSYLPARKNAQNEGTKTDDLDPVTEAYWKERRIAQEKSSKRRVDKPSQSEDSVPIRLILVDELGTRNRYKVVSSTSMREILDYYCQRHDASAEAIVLRYQGRRIPLNESPHSLALPDLSIIDVEIDYYRLHELYKKETQTYQQSLLKQLEGERLRNHDAEMKVARLEKELKAETNARKSSETALEELKTANSSLEASTQKLERDLKTHRDARRSAEQALSKLKKEYDLDKDAAEHKRLESALSRARSEVDTKDKQLKELEDQLREEKLKQKVPAESKERLKIKELVAKVDSLQEELVQVQAASAQSDAALKDQLKKSREELVTWMMKCERTEAQCAELENELASFRDSNSPKGSASADNQPSSELRKSHLLELELELVKLKQSAGQTQAEAEELSRLRSFVALATQNTALQRQQYIVEVQHWKDRAASLDHELQRLRLSMPHHRAPSSEQRSTVSVDFDARRDMVAKQDLVTDDLSTDIIGATRFLMDDDISPSMYTQSQSMMAPLGLPISGTSRLVIIDDYQQPPREIQKKSSDGK